MTVQIRPVGNDDIEGYHRLLDAVAAERRYLAMVEAPPIEQTRAFVSGIRDRRDVMLLAVEKQEVVGWCDIVTTADRPTVAHVGTLGMGIAESHRGRGLGSRLLASAVSAAWTRGLGRVQLLVFTDNVRAQALYLKHGFVVEGTRRRVVRIGDTYHDDHMMALVR